MDKSSLRDYARREALAGTELRVFNQAWGEFAHLYGDKLPEGGGRCQGCRADCYAVLQSGSEWSFVPVLSACIHHIHHTH